MGPDFPLMLDCYMALTVPYSIRLARTLEPLGLKWMEEFLPPDDYEGMNKLCKHKMIGFQFHENFHYFIVFYCC